MGSRQGTYERPEPREDGVCSWWALALVFKWTWRYVGLLAEDNAVIWASIHGEVVDRGVGSRGNHKVRRRRT